MTDIVPIAVALYGFTNEQEPIMQAAFAHADSWSTPWKITKTLEDARVIFVDLASEDNFIEIDNLKRNLPKAEIVALSAVKPPQAKWHLERQQGGKVSIVRFSQLILKISHSLKKNTTEASESLSRAVIPIAESVEVTVTEVITSISDDEGFDQEIGNDVLPFFDQLDSLLDSKPVEKRKRFNEMK